MTNSTMLSNNYAMELFPCVESGIKVIFDTYDVSWTYTHCHEISCKICLTFALLSINERILPIRASNLHD